MSLLTFDSTLPHGPAIRCDFCGLFTSRREINMYPDDVGDYGQVYSYVAQCTRDTCPGQYPDAKPLPETDQP